jgi:hypothetical protein
MVLHGAHTSSTNEKFAMKKILFPAAILLLVAACGGEINSIDESDIASSTSHLFTVRKDDRAGAASNSYWASVMHSNAAPVLVSAFDLSNAGLDAAAQAVVASAPAEELLFRARVITDKHGQRVLAVKDAYRGMPGIVPSAKDGIFGVAFNSRACVTAPCNSQTATDQISNKSTELTRVDVTAAAASFVDRDWLQNRILLHGALVTGHVATGATVGTDTVLEASQIWLHVPETPGPCAMPRQQLCTDGQVQAFARTSDRCEEPLGCVTRGVCMYMQPACAAGYLTVTWTSAPDGCPATACDPAWTVPGAQ